MRKLIYNKLWIVCGFVLGTTEDQLEEKFNNLKPYDEVIININNKERIPIQFKDAFLESSLLFMAALATGIIKQPISNESFHIISWEQGLVLMPNIPPFNKAVTAYEKGDMPFEKHVHVVKGNKNTMIGSFSMN